jgi:hypothetical protein
VAKNHLFIVGSIYIRKIRGSFWENIKGRINRTAGGVTRHFKRMQGKSALFSYFIKKEWYFIPNLESKT